MICSTEDTYEFKKGLEIVTERLTIVEIIGRRYGRGRMGDDGRISDGQTKTNDRQNRGNPVIMGLLI